MYLISFETKKIKSCNKLKNRYLEYQIKDIMLSFHRKNNNNKKKLTPRASSGSYSFQRKNHFS